MSDFRQVFRNVSRDTFTYLILELLRSKDYTFHAKYNKPFTSVHTTEEVLYEKKGQKPVSVFSYDASEEVLILNFVKNDVPFAYLRKIFKKRGLTLDAGFKVVKGGS